MDEILLRELHGLPRSRAARSSYDLWIGDEAWDLDYFLHENPELKTAPYAWLTDFVGCLPMPDGGEREAFLTADYNAEMIEHVARFPRVRDRAIFVGDADDIVPDTFGPGLPAIRAWTEQHFDFAGYVTGLRPGLAAHDRAALRAELGYRPDEPVCVVTVGGSGVGAPLLERVIDALPAARERVPALRMIAVAGPRIDPDSPPAAEGLEVRGYVPDLYRHLAACDVAVVQGGLTTAWNSPRAGRPFVYVPARAPLRAELPRAPPARTLRRPRLARLRRRHSGRPGRGDRRRAERRRRYRPLPSRRRRPRCGPDRRTAVSSA